jgi:type II secretory pathway pseudopilin PulG
MSLMEVTVALALVGIFGLAVYSLLNVGMILGAKNSAVNTAHQQARTAMLQMVQDLHSAISLPALTNENGVALDNPAPNTKAAGISFQLWSAGPYRISPSLKFAKNSFNVNVQIPAGSKVPVVPPSPQPKPRLIVPSHEIEENIESVTPLGNGTYRLTLVNGLPVDIDGTASAAKNITCFIADRCSYVVKNGALEWNGPTTRTAFARLGNDIISPTPFTTPGTPAGALYYRFVAAIDLSTSDSHYNKRGFKSANILLNGQVPIRTRLTVNQ